MQSDLAVFQYENNFICILIWLTMCIKLKIKFQKGSNKNFIGHVTYLELCMGEGTT